MTESHSDDEPLREAEPLTLEGLRVFTATTMEVYRQAALANYTEAEELLHRALELREAGHAMLERAALLAGQYALEEQAASVRLEEVFSATGGEEDDIAW